MFSLVCRYPHGLDNPVSLFELILEDVLDRSWVMPLAGQIDISRIHSQENKPELVAD